MPRDRALSCFACKRRAQVLADVTSSCYHLYYVICPSCEAHTRRYLKRVNAEKAWQTMQLEYLLKKRRQARKADP